MVEVHVRKTFPSVWLKFKLFEQESPMYMLHKLQKMVEFYHQKCFDMLKIECTLPKMANICRHISISAKLYPFTESVLVYLVERLSIVFTHKAVVDKTHTSKSRKVCKSIVGKDASQLCPYSMCQPMPAGRYTRWELVAGLQRIASFPFFSS